MEPAKNRAWNTRAVTMLAALSTSVMTCASSPYPPLLSATPFCPAGKKSSVPANTKPYNGNWIQSCANLLLALAY
jgi:hypothetical protein